MSNGAPCGQQARHLVCRRANEYALCYRRCTRSHAHTAPHITEQVHNKFMSYTQRFYLQKNEATVQNENYFGELEHQFCGQRDTQEWLELFGDSVVLGPGDVRVTYTPLQAAKMLVALGSEVAKFMNSFRSIAENGYRIAENEPGYRADRIALESYVALSIAYNSFMDAQYECPFFRYLTTEDPLELLLRYHRIIGELVQEMNEKDILVLRISY